MKQLLLLSLLLTGFVGCKKADTPAPDPFLGHWKSDSSHADYYDASRQVTSYIDANIRQDLDVTATTLTFTYYQVNGPPNSGGYTRSGEDLVFSGSNPVLVIYRVRSLTATSFTLESDFHSTLNPSSPRTVTTYTPYHR